MPGKNAKTYKKNFTTDKRLLQYQFPTSTPGSDEWYSALKQELNDKLLQVQTVPTQGAGTIPTTTHILKGDGAGNAVAGSAATVVSEFTGTPTGAKFLRDDGTLAVPASSSPLTAKGDIYGFDTANQRIPVGADGLSLTADSTQASGLKWAAPLGASILASSFSDNQTIILPNGDSYDVPGLAGSNHTGLTGVAATKIITDTAHGYVNGDRLIFSAIVGGSGLAINTNYYVISSTTNTYQVSASQGGATVAWTTDITSGTIYKLAALQATIPASSPFTKWTMSFMGLVTYGTSNTSGMACALVGSTNVNTAPGNSALIWPPNYASNATTSSFYSGITVEFASGSPQQFHAAQVPLQTLTAGTTYKLVFCARAALGTAGWKYRSLVLQPYA